MLRLRRLVLGTNARARNWPEQTRRTSKTTLPLLRLQFVSCEELWVKLTAEAPSHAPVAPFIADTTALYSEVEKDPDPVRATQ
jgi:hypothetical protein